MFRNRDRKPATMSGRSTKTKMRETSKDALNLAEANEIPERRRPCCAKSEKDRPNTEQIWPMTHTA
jgi:hypothetical protein